jgi:hypothetical protein
MATTPAKAQPATKFLTDARRERANVYLDINVAFLKP